MMSSVLDYDESKRRIKLIELRDFLSEVLPSDIFNSWSMTLDPLSIIALIEAARCRKLAKVFQEAEKELRESRARTFKGILHSLQLESLWYAISVIDEEFREIYSELDKIIPVKELVKKYGLDESNF